jgi:hypothetical protein
VIELSFYQWTQQSRCLPHPRLRMETNPASETFCSFLLCYLEYWTMDKVLNPSNPECYTPLSELFRIYFLTCLDCGLLAYTVTIIHKLTGHIRLHWCNERTIFSQINFIELQKINTLNKFSHHFWPSLYIICAHLLKTRYYSVRGR